MPSKIEWTDVSWNLIGGCEKVSPGCDRCYALSMSRRLQRFPKYQGVTENNGSLRWTGLIHCDESALREPYRWRKPRLVFVCSMSDLFHAKVSDDFINRVFEVIRNTPRHTYQILTKRTRRMVRYFDSREVPMNVWLGTTIENQDAAFRLDYLKRIDAQVRFLSCEPLLGPLDLSLDEIHWLIAGGESGAVARPMEPSWVRSLRDQCQAQEVVFFFKQWGGRNKKKAGRILDGRIWNEMPTIGGGNV